jgi:molybdate transport system permease protein
MRADWRARPDWPFWAMAIACAGAYALFIIGLLLADARWAPLPALWQALATEEIRHAAWLSLGSCTLSAAISLAIAMPIAYLLSRGRFPLRRLLDAMLDIPIVLPPLVVGLSLLIFFQTSFGRAVEEHVRFTYTVVGVVLAQVVVGTAFAIRAMRATFDHLPARAEDVALTLGASRGQAVRLVTLPAARRGMITAFTLAWARCLGEFGPVLVFAGATRMKTEVLPTSVFFELSVGNLDRAVAVSLLMVGLALLVLLVVRRWGEARR